MKHLKLVMAALSSVSGIGDIFTDARDCAASVAAVENLKVLAGMLSTNADTSLYGAFLHADGEFVTFATVSINGVLTVTMPDGFDTSGRRWELVTNDGKAFAVAMFVTDDSSDAESWVIDDADSFYRNLLAS